MVDVRNTCYFLVRDFGTACGEEQFLRLLLSLVVWLSLLDCLLPLPSFIIKSSGIVEGILKKGLLSLFIVMDIPKWSE